MAKRTKVNTEGYGTVTPPDPDRPLPVHDLHPGDVVYQTSLGVEESARFTVVEDRGHSLLCAREDGSEVEMNPEKLTKVGS